MASEKRYLMQRRQHGFTLVELAVVLVILSLLLAFGVTIGKNATNSADRLSTLERMALIKQSLDAYAARNGYLPCPADPALTPGSANFGLESRQIVAPFGCNTVGGVFQASTVWYGALPVKNLGLDESFASDNWGNKLTYAVSGNHIGSTGNHFNSYATSAVNGSIEIRSGTYASYRTTTTTTTGVPSASATYAVVSHGKNGRGAYLLNATAIVTSCPAIAGGAIDANNCDRADAIFFDSEYNDGTQSTTQFDDYIVWGTNMMTRNPPAILPNACSGTCENWCAPCEITNTSNPPVTATRICAKFITAGMPTCTARCIWPSDTMPCP